MTYCTEYLPAGHSSHEAFTFSTVQCSIVKQQWGRLGCTVCWCFESIKGFQQPRGILHSASSYIALSTGKGWTYPPAHFGLDETLIHVFAQQLTEGLTILALLTLLLLLELLLDLSLLLVQVPVQTSTHINAVYIQPQTQNPVALVYYNEGSQAWVSMRRGDLLKGEINSGSGVPDKPFQLLKTAMQTWYAKWEATGLDVCMRTGTGTSQNVWCPLMTRWMEQDLLHVILKSLQPVNLGQILIFGLSFKFAHSFAPRGAGLPKGTPP